MRIRVALVIALAAAVVTATAAAAPGLTGPRVTEASAVFPYRAYVVTLPLGMQLTTSNVRVRENGSAVDGVSVLPAARGRVKQFGVILDIDASESMAGKPIAAALDAARVFAAQRNLHQKLGIMTFNSETHLVQPLTTDGTAIAAALATPPKFTYGTKVFDAVGRSVRILANAKISPASVVVLSDGADIGSKLTEPEVAALARKAHVRVFTIGLRSRFFKRAPLKALARETGGRYFEAPSPKELAGAYSQLGYELSNEYLVEYRSLAGPGKKINVTIGVQGLDEQGRTAYRTPELKVPEQKKTPPYRRPLAERLWSSTGMLFIVSVLISVLITVAVIVLVLMPRRGAVQKRLAEFVSMPEPEEKRVSTAVTDRVLESTDRVFARTRWWSRFKWELQLAQIKTPAEQLVVFTFIATFLSVWLLTVATGSPWGGMFGFAIPLLVRAWVKRRVDRIRRRFAEQLPDNLQVLASALRAGHSFVGALSVVVEDAAEPSRTEFRRVVADEQLGVPLEDALDVVAERMQSQELAQVSLVAALQREAGGNTAEVLDSVTDTIRERMELRRLVRTLTAQGRLSRWIVSFLPVVLFLFINLINPRYMRPLYTHTGGKVMIAFGVMLVIGGSLVIKRIVNIKV